MATQQLRFATTGRDLDAVESACLAAGAVAVTLGDAADDPIYEPAPGATPTWPTVVVTALFIDADDLGDRAAALASTLGLPTVALQVETVVERAWEREWLKDFRPMRFGRRLWVCPGGQPAPDPDAIVLELDPGLAFGTGTHATTAMCLEWLDQQALHGCRVLDYGCGSGILACAALKLGAAHATGVDIDDQALLATRENAARNGLATSLTVLPVEGFAAAPFDCTLANILAGPLIELAPRLAALTLQGGGLVLAGLLDDQAPEVLDAYAPYFQIARFAARDGWTALAGVRKA